jgi:polar amino acid transport system substrate-binding protein
MDRRHFLGMSAALSAAGLFNFTLPARAEGLLERVQASKTIRVGCSSQEPTSMVTPDGYSGESLDSAELVLDAMGGIKIEPVVAQFGALIPALVAGRIDMIAQGLSITPKRCEQVLYSDPYYAKLTVIVTKKGNPFGVKNYKEVAANPEVRFGYTAGGTEGAQAADAGITEAQTATYPTSPALLDALRAGRLDAVALPDLMMNYRIGKGGWESQELEAAEPFLPQIGGVDNLTCVAFGFRHDDKPFRDAFNEVVVQKKKEGAFTPILLKYGGSEKAAQLALDLTAEQLCKA